MTDPTRAELIAFLESKYPEVTGGEPVHTEEEAEDDQHDGCGCRMEIEAAAYYLAAHYHGGQASSLYSALSTSPFRPGPTAKELPDDEEWPVASELYREGETWIEEKETA